MSSVVPLVTGAMMLGNSLKPEPTPGYVNTAPPASFSQPADIPGDGAPASLTSLTAPSGSAPTTIAKADPDTRLEEELAEVERLIAAAKKKDKDDEKTAAAKKSKTKALASTTGTATRESGNGGAPNEDALEEEKLG